MFIVFEKLRHWTRRIAQRTKKSEAQLAELRKPIS